MFTKEMMLIGFAVLAFISSYAQRDTENPLMEKSTLQYQAPMFDLIRNEHFTQAFEIGLKIHDREIEAIANNREPATFKNTILALEQSGEILNRAQLIFYNLTGSNTNETLQKIEEEYAPIFSAHNDKIYLDKRIYKKIKSLNMDALKGEDRKLTEYYLQQFELAGANLDEDKKAQIKAINEELAILSTQYSNTLLLARKNASVLFDSKDMLKGLSESDVQAAAQKASDAGFDGKYMLGIINTTQQPPLQNMANSTSREKLFNASWYRAEKGDSADTRTIVLKIAKLRLQKAKLMGKRNFAEWKLQDQMAKNPKEVMQLLKNLAGPAVKKANEEAKEIQRKMNTKNMELKPWDWNYYAEQVRKEKYDLDENEIKPYFEITTILEKGVFYAAKIMYGITFKVRKDLPVYHPDVVAYEVFDKDGKSMALYYLDFYTRDNKNGGAWMNNFVNQSHALKQKPVIVNVFNFQKPVDGNPSLIGYDDVTTMFHEFGHTLHGLFANQQYVSLSGTSVPRDYVEFPSQINEHCAMDPVILKNYAIHYKTKEPIPAKLLEKIKKAETFNKGYEVVELLAAATLDMAWHTVENESDFVDVDMFEKRALKKQNLLLDAVPTRYHSPYFAHIWGGGYSAGYYAYTWSKVLDYNTFEWMEKHGGMTRENGERFRKYILSVGNSVDLNKAFSDFVGHQMQTEPYLKYSGM
ncbi:MAG: M3 family metallopeptidase [Chitinophagaceae bacterium]